jgi:hypothetical protein
MQRPVSEFSNWLMLFVFGFIGLSVAAWGGFKIGPLLAGLFIFGLAFLAVRANRRAARRYFEENKKSPEDNRNPQT